MSEAFSIKRVPEVVKQQWRETLEHLGRDSVRLRLASGEVGSGPNSRVPFLEADHAGRRWVCERSFAEEWLAEKDRIAHGRSETQHRLLWAAVVTGSIAAIASVLALLSGG